MTVVITQDKCQSSERLISIPLLSNLTNKFLLRFEEVRNNQRYKTRVVLYVTTFLYVTPIVDKYTYCVVEIRLP